jgi:hypothetical protein
VAISTGLFDYLPTVQASALAPQMLEQLRPAGVMAICNFAPEDASRVVKDWVRDWSLVYRTAEELAGLFPPGLNVRANRSPDGSLVYATVVRP